MKRYKTAGTILSPAVTYDYKRPVRDEWDPSVTDKSYFVPISESVKTVNGAPLSASEIANNFDFKNGRDTGMKIPVDRYKGLDLAEISAHERKLRADLEAKVAEGKEELKRKKMYNDIVAPVSPVTTSPAPSSASNSVSS
ncbi:hypothetical protein [Tortoise microvirus 95]|nr:hypothetical protein [Tortoise microvirus 95]QCS37394.1 hypothetical protein [Tortoise microvirus 98]QCS37492.1 hypothetical protein [Tortoise microvirus 109]